MRLLLDTHVALWAIANAPRLSPRARELISEESNAVFVSAASIWEIAIKHALKRSSSPAIEISAKDALTFFIAAGYDRLAITAEHARLVEALPPHHADPFDRILIAQALAEPMRLVSHDAALARYGDSVIVV